MVLEASIEGYLVKRVEANGGIALKADKLAGRRFVDRICFLGNGRIVIVELKRPKNGRRSPHQVETVKRLLALGCEVYFCKTKEEVDAALRSG